MFLIVPYKFLPSSSSKPQFKTSQKAIQPVLAVCSMLRISARSYDECIIPGFNAVPCRLALPGTSENRNVLRCNTCIHKNTFNLKSAENIFIQPRPEKATLVLKKEKRVLLFLHEQCNSNIS